MKQTAQDRYNIVRYYVTSPTNLIAYKDRWRFLYHWYMMERAHLKIIRLRRVRDQHTAALNAMLDVLEFKQELQDL